jgi:AcrR family transcriptional regulator
MARGKTISDDDLLSRLAAAIAETGPEGLTFAKAAQASGLSPATLVQRFGTRDAMVEAILLRAWDLLDAETAAADAQASVDPAGAVALLVRLVPSGAAEHSLTEGLLLLREDIRNPVLRGAGRGVGPAPGGGPGPAPERSARRGRAPGLADGQPVAGRVDLVGLHPRGRRRNQGQGRAGGLVPQRRGRSGLANEKRPALRAGRQHRLEICGKAYLILPSLNSTCFRTTGSYFIMTSFSVFVRAFFFVT